MDTDDIIICCWRSDKRTYCRASNNDNENIKMKLMEWS